MSSSGVVRGYFERVTRAITSIDAGQVAKVVDLLLDIRARDGTVFICGNGGSSATAAHMAADLGKGAPRGPAKGVRAFALTDNAPLLTAWANDDCFDVVFAAQLRNLARAGDLLIAISASGDSPNILAAVDCAHEIGVETIGFCGMGGGQLASLVRHAVVVDAQEYGVIEDVHLSINHAITGALRQALLTGDSTPPATTEVSA